jgi:Secretion system C-terminal sorting domain
MRSTTSLALILVLAFAFTSFASTVPSYDPSMIGGTPVMQRISELDDGHVALIQDMASFWGNSNQDILDSMAPAVTYDIINSANIGITDLSIYDHVLIEGNQPATFNTNVNANMGDFQAYVNAGGWLQIHFGTNAPIPPMMLWDGTSFNSAGNENSNFVGPDGAGHPALNGVVPPFLGNAANHGYVTGFPVGADIIVETSVGDPTYIDYNYGGGKVVATTMTLEFLWNNAYDSGQILWNTIDWMANHTPPGPVSFDLFPVVQDIPDGGGNVVYDAQLISTIGLMMPGLRYQTFVTLPNNQQMGPIDNIGWTLTPFMNIYVAGMTLNVPNYAPAGNYMLDAMAGNPNVPPQQLWDGFPFTKHPPVGAGLHEDFEDGLAQGFVWFVGDLGSYSIDGGYAKVNVFTETDDWGSGVYTGDTFGDFSSNSNMEFAQTIGNSAGLLFRGSGVNDAAYSGYAVYLSNGYYSAWVYTAGVPANIVGWTLDPAINQGVGALNNLQIDGTGSNFDITCNGTYIGSFVDGSIASGYAGFTCAYQNETWYDDLHATHVPAPNAIGPIEIGQLDPVLRDHMGNVITDAADYYVPGVAFDRSAEIAAENNFEFIPSDWVGSGFMIASEAGSSVSVPSQYALENAYPNPFNAATTVRVTLPEAADLTVSVYNVAGQLVATIADGNYNAGQHALTFDASNIASGLYFIQATVPGQLNATQKVMLVR